MDYRFSLTPRLAALGLCAALALLALLFALGFMLGLRAAGPPAVPVVATAPAPGPASEAP